MPSDHFTLQVKDKAGHAERHITGRRLRANPDVHLTFHDVKFGQRMGVRLSQNELVQLVQDLRGLILA